MRNLIFVSILFLIAPLIYSLLAAGETRTSYWPNGNLQTVHEMKRPAGGGIVRYGLFQSYYENGSLEIEGQYANDAQHGLWTFWAEDGEKKGECRYENGIGEYIGWHSNGKVRLRGVYEDFTRIGPWVEYYPSGRKYLEGSFRNGKQHGIWINYSDEDPPRKVEAEFEDGERIR